MWGDAAGIEKAIATNNRVIKTYFLDETTIGRVDTFRPEVGLARVSYRHLEPPYEEVLEQHRHQHPGVPFDIWTPPTISNDKLHVVRIRYFDESEALTDEQEIHFADKELERRYYEVTLGPEGRAVQKAMFLYDARGEHLFTRVYDGLGEFLYQADLYDIDK
jgi:hypothetical protein